MTKPRAQRRDSMDGAVESALQPGRFIPWSEGSSFVWDLRRVESEIANVMKADPARAVALYETFIAGCTLKAEEIDDSDGELGMFAGDLYCGWIRARQAAGADRGETARLLLTFMDHDDYGFCNDLEKAAVKVLDRSGLEAFEQEIRARFDAECVAPSEAKRPAWNPNYARDRWADMLRAIYSQQREVQKYLDLTVRTALTGSDCKAIATMLQAKRKPADALAWAERGIEIGRQDRFNSATDGLLEMRRVLLVKLGRENEALDSAWTEFQSHPSRFSYEDLIRYVPKAERAAWQEKAMVAAEGGDDLASLIDLWLSAKETDRLAARLDRASDTELERLSHYTTEPAAERLAKTHPGVAARVYRALCVRILDAGKSKYYYAALSNLEKARNCYQRSGLDAQWRALTAEIRKAHSRKTGFMPGFERIVAGKWPAQEPSFLDRARRNWEQKGRA